MPYFFTSEGINLYYEIHGKGRPIVCIHPPLMGLAVFMYQKLLSDDNQVVLYDLRGHGRSGYRPTQDIHHVVDDHVADLRELIIGLKLEKPIILGYSNGALLALEYAIRYTEDTGALILSGGYPVIDSWLLAAEYRIGIAMMQLNQKKQLSALLAISHKVTAADQRALFEHAIKAEKQAVLDLYRSGVQYNATRRLTKLDACPLLLLYGTRDTFISKHRKYFESLSRCDTVLIDKAFHQLPTRHHHVFNRVIREYLVGLPSE